MGNAFHRKFLYFPRKLQLDDALPVVDFCLRELSFYTLYDNTLLYAYWISDSGEDAESRTKPTLMYFHGNEGSIVKFFSFLAKGHFLCLRMKNADRKSASLYLEN